MGRNYFIEIKVRLFTKYYVTHYPLIFCFNFFFVLLVKLYNTILLAEYRSCISETVNLHWNGKSSDLVYQKCFSDNTLFNYAYIYIYFVDSVCKIKFVLKYFAIDGKPYEVTHSSVFKA